MEKIYVDGYDFFFWEYEPQTKIKHFVFKEYFKTWAQILGKWNKLNYFDCYAGSGAYIEGQNQYFGSPILATEIIEKNKEGLGRQVNVVLIEQDKENIENILKVFKYKGLKTEPIIIAGDFDETINKILDKTQDSLNPTFFFIDPFGFKINIQTLKRIMSIPRSEILLNFMFNHINRFLIDDLEKTLNELFGCEDWKALRNLRGGEREQGIVSLYRAQLKTFSKFAYPYKLNFHDKNRTYYYLFHLTNNLKGCTIMKSAFAKFNYGKVEFSGPSHEIMSFFDLKDFKASEIKKFLLNKYRGSSKSCEEILTENIDETPYLESEIRDALKKMEGNEIKITRIPNKTPTGRDRKSIEGQDVFEFKENCRD